MTIRRHQCACYISAQQFSKLNHFAKMWAPRKNTYDISISSEMKGERYYETHYLIFLIACSGSVIHRVPKGNRHYVEGESRFIWMSDSKGAPQLVDLDEPIDHSVLNSKNGANNQYWLFTRYVCRFKLHLIKIIIII
jgi:hypothetical protein